MRSFLPLLSRRDNGACDCNNDQHDKQVRRPELHRIKITQSRRTMSATSSEMTTLLRKRRWLKFSIRTLLVAVTLLCVFLSWLAWQIRIVGERAELVRLIEGARGTCETSADFVKAGYVLDDSVRSRIVPVVRQWLGDQSYWAVTLHGQRDEKFISQIARTFPEAVVHVLDDNGTIIDQRGPFSNVN
jgi:hypothetical protein